MVGEPLDTRYSFPRRQSELPFLIVVGSGRDFKKDRNSSDQGGPSTLEMLETPDFRVESWSRFPLY